MNNRTYVCLDCKTAKRADPASYLGLRPAYRCSLCKEPLICLDKRCRIPGKSDASGWLDLRRYLAGLKDITALRREAKAHAGSRKINIKIAAIASNPHTKRKRAKLRDLKEMAKVDS